jgi:hypothetical protein
MRCRALGIAFLSGGQAKPDDPNAVRGPGSAGARRPDPPVKSPSS